MVFLYLPDPPSDNDEAESYLSALSRLTRDWPPTIMVRGVSPVTSITF